MNLNLNKKLVNKDDLLNDIIDLEVYRCYCPDLEIDIGKPVLSPLRSEKNPSFGLFVGDNNEILFNDFLLGGGDCVRFVQLLFGDTYFEALSRIVIDFDLTDKYYYKDINTKHTPPKKSLDKSELLTKVNSSLIRKKRRKWGAHDLIFWEKYGIDLDTLEKYYVEPIEYIFVNNKIISCDRYTYCYIEFKDKTETYKIYQPYKDKYKWLNNHNESVWQGWTQLPATGEKLIITKSLKDVMTITALTGIPAVSLQAESVKPKSHIMDELKSRFDTIWIWYDNDFDAETNWGLKFSEQLAEEFGLLMTYIPTSYQIKDISDFVKDKGIKKAISLINELTSTPF